MDWRIFRNEFSSSKLFLFSSDKRWVGKTPQIDLNYEKSRIGDQRVDAVRSGLIWGIGGLVFAKGLSTTDNEKNWSSE